MINKSIQQHCDYICNVINGTGFMISPLVQSVGYALITKSVGSGYRVFDDRKAPNPIRQNTLGREATLLSLTTVFTTALQKILTPMIKASSTMMRNELLIRALFTAPALAISELSSRLLYPKHQWQKNETNTLPLNHIDNVDHDDDDEWDEDEDTFQANQPSLIKNNPFNHHPQTTFKAPLLYNTSGVPSFADAPVQKQPSQQSFFTLDAKNQQAYFMKGFR